MHNKVGILLASHGDYCKGAKNSLEMIIGSCPNLLCVSITPQTSNEEANEEMKKAYSALSKASEEVLIFTDLLCGTPNNIAVRMMMETDNVTVITGYNLAVLVEIINRRNTSNMNVDELVKDCKNLLNSSLRIMTKKGEI